VRFFKINKKLSSVAKKLLFIYFFLTAGHLRIWLTVSKNKKGPAPNADP